MILIVYLLCFALFLVLAPYLSLLHCSCSCCRRERLAPRLVWEGPLLAEELALGVLVPGWCFVWCCWAAAMFSCSKLEHCQSKCIEIWNFIFPHILSIWNHCISVIKTGIFFFFKRYHSLISTYKYLQSLFQICRYMCAFAIQNVSKLSISKSGTFDTDSWIYFLSWSFRSLFPLLPFLKLISKKHEIPKNGHSLNVLFHYHKQENQFCQKFDDIFFKTDRESL